MHAAHAGGAAVETNSSQIFLNIFFFTSQLGVAENDTSIVLIDLK
jgi:hypothetical protein